MSPLPFWVQSDRTHFTGKREYSATYNLILNLSPGRLYSTHHQHCLVLPSLSQCFWGHLDLSFLYPPLAWGIPETFPFYAFACSCIHNVSLVQEQANTWPPKWSLKIRNYTSCPFNWNTFENTNGTYKWISSQKSYIFICPVFPFSREFIDQEMSKNVRKNKENRYNVTCKLQSA